MAVVTDFPGSLLEFQQRFGDEAACAQYLAAARWPGGFVCPGCGGSKAWRLETPGSFGYRPKRTAHDAIKRVAEAIVQRKTRVLDFDLRAYLERTA